MASTTAEGTLVEAGGRWAVRVEAGGAKVVDLVVAAATPAAKRAKRSSGGSSWVVLSCFMVASSSIECELHGARRSRAAAWFRTLEEAGAFLEHAQGRHRVHPNRALRVRVQRSPGRTAPCRKHHRSRSALRFGDLTRDPGCEPKAGRCPALVRLEEHDALLGHRSTINARGSVRRGIGGDAGAAGTCRRIDSPRNGSRARRSSPGRLDEARAGR